MIYQTCSEQFKIVLSEGHIREVQQKYQLPSEYLIYVGSVVERKNLLGLLEAIRNFPKDLNISLVVVGKGGNYLKEVQNFIQKHGLQKRVYFPKYKH